MKHLLCVLALVPFAAFAGFEESIGKIESVMGTMEAASGALALVMEFVFRLLPTKKPLSFAHLGVKFLRMVCRLFEKTADLLDKILPQNVQEDESKES